jgi:hypothetical protein
MIKVFRGRLPPPAQAGAPAGAARHASDSADRGGPAMPHSVRPSWAERTETTVATYFAVSVGVGDFYNFMLCVLLGVFVLVGCFMADLGVLSFRYYWRRWRQQG